MEIKKTWFFIILHEIVPIEEHPVVTEEMRGKITDQTKLWIKWGYERGYLK